MEDNNIDFAEFESAFDDADDYQTDGAEDTAETEVTGDSATEGGDENPGTPADGDDPAGEDEREDGPGEGGKEDKQTDPGETFTIRVNKEDRTVGREEMISLAQKGADYDRVKGQLTESRQTIQNMQAKLDNSQAVMDVLEMISTETGTTIDQLLEQVHVNFRVKKGETEAEAKANIRALKAEKQVSSMQAKETAKKTAESDTKNRAAKEVADFHKRFPNVELTEQLCSELMADVQSGMPLADAYQKRELARKDAEIAELKRQMEADKQNKKNRSNSPGSQQDSGGRRAKSDFDEFMAAFE